MYFLDTNICIYLLNHKYPKLNKHFAAYNKKLIKIPSVVLFELQYGAEKSYHHQKNLIAVNDFIKGMEIVPFCDKAAGIAGKIRAELERSGTVIGASDLLIAATTLVKDGIIVTNNIREFSRIDGLAVEDWTVF